MKKRNQLLLIFVFFLLIGMPQVSALKLIQSNTSEEKKKEYCNEYQKCIEKEVAAAKKDNRTLSSSEVQIACQSVRPVNSQTQANDKNQTVDYCDANHYINLKELLKDVQSNQDAYQEDKKKCQEQTKNAREKACSACQSCIDAKGKEGYQKGYCDEQCRIDTPSVCSSNSQAGSMAKLPVEGDGCKLNIPSDGSTGNDKPTYKPNSTVGCEIISDDLLDFLAEIYHLIRGVAIVATIFLGILDFMKATASHDADALKKAGNKFMKRIIVLAILIMLPYLIEFVMSLIYGVDKADACLGKF
ncbi:MAG: hypothetical protein KH135_00440 [Firmicutes bacterium]|nr:hypothetical protein [Bacillota bacterium]